MLETSGLRCILADVSLAGSGGVRGVGDCTCIVPTLSALREASGPQIDRIPPTRPPWRRRQYRELKKLLFSPPSKCPIDLFGRIANRTSLKQLCARRGGKKQKQQNGFLNLTPPPPRPSQTPPTQNDPHKLRRLCRPTGPQRAAMR